MKLVALKNNIKRHSNPLIKDEIYEGSYYSDKYEHYWCVNRCTQIGEIYSKDELMPLSEWRDKQIKEILDER